MGYPTLFIKDVDLLKQIAVKNFDSFTDHRFLLPKQSDPLFAENLGTLKGNDWRTMRSILSPTFTANKMKFLFELTNNHGKAFIKHFKNLQNNHIELEMQEAYAKFCSDVMADSLFGININTFEDPVNEFYIHGKNLTDFTPLRKQMKFMLCLAFPALYKMLNFRFVDDKEANFFRRLVKDSIKQRKEQGIVRPDMMHLLLEAQKQRLEKQTDGNAKQVTYDDILSRAVTFFLWGFDPVSRLMSFATYELAANPDIQQKLRQEINNTLEKCNGELNYDALMGMKYMNMVVNETLRKYPSQVATERVCTKPFTIESQFKNEPSLIIPPETGITIPTFAIHRDPELFPNPDRFDPERFSEENKCNIKAFSFQPFGLGPRNCIGSRFAIMETKIILFYLLSQFEIVPIKRTQMPLVLLKNIFSLSAEKGFWLGLQCLDQVMTVY